MWVYRRNRPAGIFEVSILVCLSQLFLSSSSAQIQQSPPPAAVGPLTAQQVVANLEQNNLERARALGQFQGTRIYRMQYRGFPGSRDAEMVVRATYTAPATKEFTVLSQSGSKLIIDRVFMKLLEGEKEALQPENRDRTALNTSNYDFTLEGFESGEASQYVLSVAPRSKNKFLYRGKIWVDAKDFAVTRIAAEPAKNPSFWIKKSVIHHKYIKVDDFWLPAEDHTESQIRLGGIALLSIEYQDYKIIQAEPLNKKVESVAEETHPARSPARR